MRIAVILFLSALVLGQPSPVNYPMDPPHGRNPRSELFVSVDGQPDAPGTREQPLSLAAALADTSPARPGDIVWLRGGTYAGVFVSKVRGLPDAPIVFRQYPGERAIIDSRPSPESALTVLGSWTTFWGFEVTNSEPERRTLRPGPWPEGLGRGSGVFARGPHNAFINLVVHDMANGFGVWEDSHDTVVYGNIVFYNGWEGPDRAHGHGIYTQNRTGTRLIADNIVFGQFSHGIHAFGSDSAYLDNIILRGNVVFNNGALARSGSERNILLGGGRVAARPVLESNATFGPAQSALGWDAGCSDGRVSNNTFVGSVPLVLVGCHPEMTGNTFVGMTEGLSGLYNGATENLATTYPHNRFLRTSEAEGVSTMLRVNEYDPSRAHLVIYNWSRDSRVEVDPRPWLAPGESYRILDAQNYFGPPVLTGTYADGTRLSIPLTSIEVTPPVGQVPTSPRHTAPEFAVFVIVSGPPPRR
jgi:hypothetical protein